MSQAGGRGWGGVPYAESGTPRPLDASGEGGGGGELTREINDCVGGP